MEIRHAGQPVDDQQVSLDIHDGLILSQRTAAVRAGSSERTERRITHADSLGNTIAGEVFGHQLHHFVLAYSGWEPARVVCLIGWSGMRCRGTARGARASRRLPKVSRRRFGARAACLPSTAATIFQRPTAILGATRQGIDTRLHEAFCGHDGLVTSRNNPGEAHESGAVEADVGHLGSTLDQALIVSGGRDFARGDD